MRRWAIHDSVDGGDHADEGGENVFRVCGRDDQQGDVAGKFLVENFGDELWEVVVMVERQVLGKLHHPLLLNLAYAIYLYARSEGDSYVFPNERLPT